MASASNVKIHVTYRGDVLLDVTADCAENVNAFPQFEVITLEPDVITLVTPPADPVGAIPKGVLILPPAGNTLNWGLRTQPDPTGDGSFPSGFQAMLFHKTNPVFLTIGQLQGLYFQAVAGLLKLTFIWV
jgi:hypothetical protein